MRAVMARNTPSTPAHDRNSPSDHSRNPDASTEVMVSSDDRWRGEGATLLIPDAPLDYAYRGHGPACPLCRTTGSVACARSGQLGQAPWTSASEDPTVRAGAALVVLVGVSHAA